MPDNPPSTNSPQDRIQELETQIAALTGQLNELRRSAPGTPVPDYSFQTLEGEVRLSDLFAGRDKLLAIHNMGQGCRYCTLWADGINGFLLHLESAMSVVLLSKDPPDVQRRFAGGRGWRFRLASQQGGDYMREQTACSGHENMPGAVLYELQDSVILSKNAVVFGPGDMFCPAWNFLALAGLGESDWTPQFNYWLRLSTLDDGGENLLG